MSWWKLLLMSITALALIYSAAMAEFQVEVDRESDPATETFSVEILREEKALPVRKYRVLIYHTHTYEAYEQCSETPYIETEKWRTKDRNHNVIAVGEALASNLRACGIETVHDMTAFEPPSIDQAYERSRLMLERRLSAGEVYDLYIDLHRDALASQSTVKRTVNIAGESVARFMVLVGKGTTGGYEDKPDWERNLAVAQAITDALNVQYDGLSRNVKIKTGRFNQHISDRSVLIECGVNTNTLEEVLAGIPYLAEAIINALENIAENSPVEATSTGE